ncbi:MAG: hypothetical protein IT559_06050, partial [Alphaproteobacteria bacterium]|nr:hypothetical protein [Alphaproteobacteria bacterium]
MASKGANATQADNQASNKVQADTQAPASVSVENLAVSPLPADAIDKPAAGSTLEVAVEPGQQYSFSFSSDAVQNFQQSGGDLILRFDDGSAIALKGFSVASATADPATLAFSDAISPDALALKIYVPEVSPPDEAQLQAAKAELRKENADSVEGQIAQDEAVVQADIKEIAAAEKDMAELLAKIEPAAGENAGAPGSPQNTGFTFSNPEITPVGPLNAVGPIDPTALQYGVNFQNPDLLFRPEEDLTPPNSLPEVDVVDLAVDESDLAPSLSVSGAVPLDFGGDGPGTVFASGAFQANGSLAGGALSSGGVAIIVTATPTGYVGMAGGVKVFDLVFDPATPGAFTFTQSAAIDHQDGTNPNDVISLVFGVTAQDADGDQSSTSITIFVADDAPGLTPPVVEAINESALSGGLIVVGDVLAVDFGNDVGGTVSLNGTNSVNGVAALTSGGQAVTIVATAGGYEGQLPGGAKVFALSVNPATGAYEYTQFKGLDHAVGQDIISLVFGVDVIDFDGDRTDTTITVNIKDSVPTLNGTPVIGAGLEVVDESNLPGGSVASGKLDLDFGSDTPGTVGPDGVTDSSIPLTSGGQVVTITQTANGYVGTINGGADTVFALSISADGSYNFIQSLPLDHADASNPDDAITLSFGVSVRDADGDTALGTIKVDVRDDGPDAVNDTAQLKQNAAQASGNVLANDDAGADAPGVVSKVVFDGTTYVINAGAQTTINATHGTLKIGQNGAWTYTAKGGNATDVFDKFIYTLKDADGDTDSAELKIKTPDQNDEPLVVSVKALVVDESDLNPVDSDTGQIVADFGVDGPGTYLANDPSSFSFNGAKGGALTSNGVPVVVSVSGNDYVG